jgi:hypothetical protein
MAERLARLQELLAMLQAANEVASATESGDVSRLLADLDVMSAGASPIRRSIPPTAAHASQPDIACF